ncbi:MAG: type II toxin-antitoxin system VapC family toxin [Tagaea sp.]|nr:type II toxin-antitoxin system VapC family toxin [Tagaea sp.]
MLVDTNVLVFATQATSPRHASARARLSLALNDERRLFVTPQILREYLSVVTRFSGLERPLSGALAIERVAQFRRLFDLLPETGRSQEILEDFVARGICSGRLVHDANIAATMLANGVTRILTDNGADFRRFAPDIETVDLA